MKQLKEFIILSAELSINDLDTNKRLSDNLELSINDLRLDYIKCKGKYKGTLEDSFLVIVKDEDEISTIINLGLKSFKQDSVLFRDLYGNASLIYGSGKNELIGKFKQGTSDIASTIVNNVEWVCN